MVGVSSLQLRLVLPFVGDRSNLEELLHGQRKRLKPGNCLFINRFQVTFLDKCRALKMTGGGLSRSQVLPPVWLHPKLQQQQPGMLPELPGHVGLSPMTATNQLSTAGSSVLTGAAGAGQAGITDDVPSCSTSPSTNNCPLFQHRRRCGS
ncbi:hypothetical protein VitviT2T_023440 [Vitis vinifera]|uniref:Uncharacterized protein n=1 Tax=Vitis vinifera TaxID=29760 RepID=A0ABY9DFX0_VITVI|nr:hypothetical protein VitviT2T_023440 [Vitis vinifera]